MADPAKPFAGRDRSGTAGVSMGCASSCPRSAPAWQGDARSPHPMVDVTTLIRVRCARPSRLPTVSSTEPPARGQASARRTPKSSRNRRAPTRKRGNRARPVLARTNSTTLPKQGRAKEQLRAMRPMRNPSPTKRPAAGVAGSAGTTGRTRARSGQWTIARLPRTVEMNQPGVHPRKVNRPNQRREDSAPAVPGNASGTGIARCRDDRTPLRASDISPMELATASPARQ